MLLSASLGRPSGANGSYSSSSIYYDASASMLLFNFLLNSIKKGQFPTSAVYIFATACSLLSIKSFVDFGYLF